MKEKFSASKLLAIVLCLQLAAVSVGVIADQFSNDAWLRWIERGITVAIYCFWFLLGLNNRSYRLTAYFKVTALFFILAGWLMSANYIIYLFYEYFGLTAEDTMPIRTVLYWIRVSAVLIASVLEYLSHGKLVPDVKKSWVALMIANLAWIVIGNAINQYTGAQFDAQLLSAETLYAISDGFRVINLVFQLFYLWLLYRTIKAVKAEETV